MALNLPPPPKNLNTKSLSFQDWFERLRRSASSVVTVFTGLDFTGSNLTSILTRDHNDLTSKQGGTAGQFYHLTAAEVAALHSAATILDTSSLNLSITGQQISGVVLPAGVDHSQLNNLNSSSYTHLTSTNHTDLTDGGDSSLHFHSSDRNRSNHTGTQSLSTISDAGTAASQNYSSGTWTPTFTGLTIVLGGGSVSYSGRWQRIGNIVKFTVTITPSGGATTASIAGTSYCDMGVPASFPDGCVSANLITFVGLGTGAIDEVNDRIYPPAWAATTNTVVISGVYEA